MKDIVTKVRVLDKNNNVIEFNNEDMDLDIEEVRL